LRIVIPWDILGKRGIYKETGMFSVIMCDDELWVLKGLQTIIDWPSHGFSSIKTFQRPAEALKAILNDEPDLVITDVKMPGLSGLELMERARGCGSKSIFVIVSAYAEFDYVQRALEGGAFSYLVKPLEEAKVIELAEKVSGVLRKREKTMMGAKLRKLVLQTLTSNEPMDVGSLLEIGQHDGQSYRFYAQKTLPPSGQGMWTRVHDELYIGVVAKDHRLLSSTSWGRGSCFTSTEALTQSLREALIAYYTVLFHGRAEWKLSYQVPGSTLHGNVSTLLEAVREGDTVRALSLVEEYGKCCTQEGVGVVSGDLAPAAEDDVPLCVVLTGRDKALAIAYVHALTPGKQDLHVGVAVVDLIRLLLDHLTLVAHDGVAQRGIGARIPAER
jgi:FixJ family two-component response regulator